MKIKQAKKKKITYGGFIPVNNWGGVQYRHSNFETMKNECVLAIKSRFIGKISQSKEFLLDIFDRNRLKDNSQRYCINVRARSKMVPLHCNQMLLLQLLSSTKCNKCINKSTGNRFEIFCHCLIILKYQYKRSGLFFLLF